MRRAAEAAGVDRQAFSVANIVNISQAKTSLSRLVAWARAGEEIMIARNGEPLVKLVPVSKAAERKPRVPDRWKGQIWIAPDRFNEMSEHKLRLWE
jgi:prevent-host-death family protein